MTSSLSSLNIIQCIALSVLPTLVQSVPTPGGSSFGGVFRLPRYIALSMLTWILVYYWSLSGQLVPGTSRCQYELSVCQGGRSPDVIDVPLQKHWSLSRLIFFIFAWFHIASDRHQNMSILFFQHNFTTFTFSQLWKRKCIPDLRLCPNVFQEWWCWYHRVFSAPTAPLCMPLLTKTGRSRRGRSWWTLSDTSPSSTLSEAQLCQTPRQLPQRNTNPSYSLRKKNQSW